MEKTGHLAGLVYFKGLYKSLLLIFVVVSFELIIFLIGGVGEGGFPGDWVGDVCFEIVVVEGVPPWYEHVEGDVVGGAEVFPEGGEWLVFGLQVDRHLPNLFVSRYFRLEVEGWVICDGFL